MDSRPGITKEVWDYIQSPEIAHRYDVDYRGFSLFDLDTKFLLDYLPQRSAVSVLDLGCGTGRSLLTVAARGANAVGVDLSPHMLRLAQQKLNAAGFGPPQIRLFQADMTDLHFLDDASADLAICFFSTFGLIAGYENRVNFLRGVARVLMPGGTLLLHTHNRYYPLLRGHQLRWLVASWLASRAGKSEFGDQFYDDYLNAIPRMFLHTFGPRELRRTVEDAGFEFVELRFVHANRGQFIRGGFFKTIRSNGLFVAARKPRRIGWE